MARLEKDESIREEILDLMELFVPGLSSIKAETARLDGSRVLTFIEEHSSRPFPSHLISDGTIHLLSLLVAILDRKNPGMTLIEEPEREIHPQVAGEMVDVFREEANNNGPIWLTTHNEMVVRKCKPGELWLVDKKEGRTQIKQAPARASDSLSMVDGWLCNVFGGGLPW
ncbi:MAG: ATP-binding protein [Magnetococcales bacterium]|nr:ATP-binding protein [Magnetococcales bacterium]